MLLMRIAEFSCVCYCMLVPTVNYIGSIVLWQGKYKPDDNLQEE